MTPLRAVAPPLPTIPVYRPDLSGNERRYVLECLDTAWISSLGGFIERFEGAVRAATGAHHAIGLCNGTVALHLALHCLGVGPGDEVIVPTFTYIASVNAIAQSGATPVFADCREGDWLLDPADAAARVTPRTKAILPVHLYGAACDMPALGALAEARGLGVVEDCAEAFGTTLTAGTSAPSATSAPSPSSATRPSPPAKAAWSSAGTRRWRSGCGWSAARASRRRAATGTRCSASTTA
jgi:perosamine synthetase